MPRRNKHKDYTRGKEAVCFNNSTGNSEYKPECVSCAFAGYGGVCKATDGVCLLGKGKSDLAENAHVPS